MTIAYLSIIVYNIIHYSDLEKYNLTFIVILITSIATGSFFLIRIYIENQLGIQEKEMLKEYQESLNKQTREQNIKFEKIDFKFSNIENGQKKIRKTN